MPGTEIYLEGFQATKQSKPKEQFKEPNEAGEKNKKPFIPNSGPQDAEGFTDKKLDGNTTAEKDNQFATAKFSQGTEKTVKENLNNSRRTKLMSEKKNTPKSEFDRLCEEVLGPEEVELGIEDAPTGEGDETCSDGTCDTTGTPAERLRGLITELEGILAELEGGTSEEAPAVDAGADDVSLDDAGATPGGAVKEAVEAEELGTPITGMKTGKPDAVTGRANVVEGEASKVTKGPGDGKIQKPGTGDTETAPDGKAQVGKPKGSMAVKGKITGKNQPLFH